MMNTQVLVAVLMVIGSSVGYPRTYQEQRQIYYPQPIPVQQRLAAAAPQVYVQQPSVLQVPAATQLLPNNVNDGLRYGQQQVLYVVPNGAQVYYEEQGGEGGSSGGGYVDTFLNLLQGASNYFPFVGSGQQPAGGGGTTTAEEAKPEKEEKPEKLEQPERLEQGSAGAAGEQSNLVAAPEQPLQQQQQLLQQQLQQQQLQQQQLQQPQPQQLQQQQQPQQLQQQQQPQQQQPAIRYQQQLPQKYFLQPQQQSFDKYLALRNQQIYANTPGAVGLPSANLLYYKNPAQLADYSKKPGTAAIEFQRFLNKAHENHHHPNTQTTTEKEENETDEQSTTSPEGEQSQTEELGPSIAQAKPQAVSVAGPGGVAAAAPVGTAIVGPGGMALSAPQATAVAGTKPKPTGGSDKLVRTYLPRNSAFSAYYPY
ncbi:hypothetical protein O3M35_000954 [Rhynocoris fuscipes]|uniref:DUF4774 domain-containing protein n=1 Tax=Rhynocoris fuscipes TaxID=488301 RepID=A0AAW1DPJ6_9HEMI